VSRSTRLVYMTCRSVTKDEFLCEVAIWAALLAVKLSRRYINALWCCIGWTRVPHVG